MTNLIKAAAIAIALAAGAIASTGTASAYDGRIGVGVSGPGFYFGFGNEPRRYKRHHRRFHDEFGFERGFCRPRRALRKARSRGLRRAYIARVGHRGVIVKGRKWGERVTVGFANRRGCPVRFVRAR